MVAKARRGAKKDYWRREIPQDADLSKLTAHSNRDQGPNS
jgi:hypothetical protein